MKTVRVILIVISGLMLIGSCATATKYNYSEVTFLEWCGYTEAEREALVGGYMREFGNKTGMSSRRVSADLKQMAGDCAEPDYEDYYQTPMDELLDSIEPIKVLKVK